MVFRVLIADADAALAEAYREHLSALEVAVRTASDGVTCVNQLRQFKPHLLLLDTSLPWGGGDGVLAVMQEDRRLRPAFVVVLVATSEHHALYRAASGPLDDFLCKPFSPMRLQTYVSELLGLRADLACGLTSD
jgi:CheY-like chemotaxis protein